MCTTVRESDGVSLNEQIIRNANVYVGSSFKSFKFVYHLLREKGKFVTPQRRQNLSICISGRLERMVTLEGSACDHIFLLHKVFLNF